MKKIQNTPSNRTKLISEILDNMSLDDLISELTQIMDTELWDNDELFQKRWKETFGE